MADTNDLYKFTAGVVTIAPNDGVEFNPHAGRISVYLTPLSGGTLSIGPTGYTASIGGSTCPLLNPFATDMRGPFALYATGATCTCGFLLGKSAGI